MDPHPVGGRAPLWLGCWVAAVCLFLVAPILVALAVSFSSGETLAFPPPGFSLRWYLKLADNRQLLAALGQSVWVGLASTAIAIAAGTPAAIAINHADFPGRAVVRAALLLPLSLPGIVLGLGLLAAIVSFGLRPGVAATILGHSVLGTPFIAYFVLATLASYDLDLERASLNLGAGRLRTFWHVTLPAIRPGIAVGGVFAFLMSFDNVSLSLFLSRNDMFPLRLLQSIQFYSDPSVAAAAGLIVGLSLLLLALIGPALARGSTLKGFG